MCQRRLDLKIRRLAQFDLNKYDQTLVTDSSELKNFPIIEK